MDNNNAITEAAYDSPGLSPGKYNSYDTNEQVKEVDETKVIKSNDTQVFTANKNEMAVWDAVNGNILSRTGHTDPSHDNSPLTEEKTNKHK